MGGSLLALAKSIYYKRARINIALFTDIVQNSNHKLHHSLPTVTTLNSCSRSLGYMRMFSIPACKTQIPAKLYYIYRGRILWFIGPFCIIFKIVHQLGYFL